MKIFYYMLISSLFMYLIITSELDLILESAFE